MAVAMNVTFRSIEVDEKAIFVTRATRGRSGQNRPITLFCYFKDDDTYNRFHNQVADGSIKPGDVINLTLIQTKSLKNIVEVYALK